MNHYLRGVCVWSLSSSPSPHLLLLLLLIICRDGDAATAGVVVIPPLSSYGDTFYTRIARRLFP